MSTTSPDPIETLSLWSDEQVKIGDVLRALEDLRKAELMPATRASVLTLVVVATQAASVQRTNAALRILGGRHPARVLMLLVDRDHSDSVIDARIELLGGDVDGRAVWFEHVTLAVCGPVGDHLDSLIEPFTVPDLPVVVWFVDSIPPVGDPMLAAADVVLVDARDFGDTNCFETLAALQPAPVVDVSWHRLRPWRELLASLFEGPEARAYLADVRSVTVAGKTGPRHLLGGWIADRLAVPMPEVHLEAADHVSIEVIAYHEGRRAVFDVCRTTDERVVRARADFADGPTSDLVVPLPQASPAWGLADALSHLERDPVYEGALAAAIALANR